MKRRKPPGSGRVRNWTPVPYRPCPYCGEMYKGMLQWRWHLDDCDARLGRRP